MKVSIKNDCDKQPALKIAENFNNRLLGASKGWLQQATQYIIILDVGMRGPVIEFSLIMGPPVIPNRAEFRMRKTRRI